MTPTITKDDKTSDIRDDYSEEEFDDVDLKSDLNSSPKTS